MSTKLETYQCFAPQHREDEIGMIVNSAFDVVVEIYPDGDLWINEDSGLDEDDIYNIVNANRGEGWTDEDFPRVFRRFFLSSR